MTKVELKVGKVVNVNIPREFSSDGQSHIYKEYIIEVKQISNNELAIRGVGYDTTAYNTNFSKPDISFFSHNVLTNHEFRVRYINGRLTRLFPDTNYEWYSNGRLTGEVGKNVKDIVAVYLKNEEEKAKSNSAQIKKPAKKSVNKAKVKELESLLDKHKLFVEYDELVALVGTGEGPELVKKAYGDSHELPTEDVLGEKDYKRYLQLTKELDIYPTDYVYYD